MEETGQLHTVPGTRRGMTLFTTGNGYFYRYVAVNPAHTHFKCYKPKCTARIYSDNKLAHVTVNPNFAIHCHEPEPLVGASFELRTNILNRAAEETRQFRVMFNEECAKYPPEVGALLSFEKLESSLHRIRRNHQNKKHLKSADNTDWELEEGNR